MMKVKFAYIESIGNKKQVVFYGQHDTAAQRKNNWRSRRRQTKRDESNKCDAYQLTQPTPESLRKWALDVIQYYVSLWDFAKVTPLMTIHKKKLFSHLMSSFVRSVWRLAFGGVHVRCVRVSAVSCAWCVCDRMRREERETIRKSQWGSYVCV